jgi:lysozyme
MSDQALFAAVRAIVGRGLTQAEVDSINRALGRTIVAAAVTGMRASADATAIIHEFEGFQAKAYPDPGSRNGLPVTCGYGSTRHLDGRPIQLGETWTREYAARVFARDLAVFEQGVNTLLKGRPTTQSQFDALVSLSYNIGLDIDDDAHAEGLGDSSLLRHHLAGDYAKAKAAFRSWRFNDGKEMRGLVRRREAEAALYGRSS